ncbi:BnaC05g03810D [Brassica napus]|uniref:BnaC05g03810D protein n=1 Tax=Brassica napus TaxID=3708 RepID=A0A078FDK4_BRANA|nr:BnaC05g03810D [Brassica napus]
MKQLSIVLCDEESGCLLERCFLQHCDSLCLSTWEGYRSSPSTSSHGVERVHP